MTLDSIAFDKHMDNYGSYVYVGTNSITTIATAYISLGSCINLVNRNNNKYVEYVTGKGTPKRITVASFDEFYGISFRNLIKLIDEKYEHQCKSNTVIHAGMNRQSKRRVTNARNNNYIRPKQNNR